jgi:hypothetical protein
MTAHALGRMRHLDLLALYFQIRGDGDHGNSKVDPMGRASTGALVRAILAMQRKAGRRP